MLLMRVLELLWVVVLLLSCQLCRRRFASESMVSLLGCPGRGCWDPYGLVLGLFVGDCLDVVLSIHPFARRCRVGVYRLCVLRP